LSEEIIVRVEKTIYLDSFPSRCLTKKYTSSMEIKQEKLFRGDSMDTAGQIKGSKFMLRAIRGFDSEFLL
jgi:hypothetical protein